MSEKMFDLKRELTCGDGNRVWAYGRYIPPNLPFDHEYRFCGLDDRAFQNDNANGAMACYIYQGDYKKSEFIGIAIFVRTETALHCENIDIDRSYRRVGIATKLYDLAEEVFSEPVTMSEFVLEDGVSFWENRNKAVKSDDSP